MELCIEDARSKISADKLPLSLDAIAMTNTTRKSTLVQENNASHRSEALPVRRAALGRYGTLAVLALIIAATAIIYWPGVHGGFALDDFPNIVDNGALHIKSLTLETLLNAAFSSHAGLLHRPLSMLSFAVNEYFWGSSPYSMKVTNIIIHLCNGALVYAVIALLLEAYRSRFRPDLTAGLIRWTTLAITASWLLAPINLTGVLYVVQRMTSLSGTFTLAGVALYVWGRLRMLEGRSGLWGSPARTDAQIGAFSVCTLCCL
ncbi:MAG: hypothetical protein P8180_08970 [Gammaproteobacteria bacterium]